MGNGIDSTSESSSTDAFAMQLGRTLEFYFPDLDCECGDVAVIWIRRSNERGQQVIGREIRHEGFHSSACKYGCAFSGSIMLHHVNKPIG